MISSIHTTVFNKKIIDYVEESVTQEDIERVEAEIIQELEELYNDDDEEVYEDVEYDYDEMEKELI